MVLKKDYKLIGIVLILTLFSIGIYYLLPMYYLNPYEYLYGSELKEYQIYNLIFGGVMIPLVSLVTGYVITREDYRWTRVLRVQAILFVILCLVSILMNGFIGIFMVPLAGIIVLFFRDKPIIFSIIIMIGLTVLHLFLFTLLPSLTAIGGNDISYSSIQEFNNYVGTYRAQDIVSMIQLNIDTLKNSELITTFIFIGLPFTFLGSILNRIHIESLIAKSGGIFITVFVLLGGVGVKLIEILSLGMRSGVLIGNNIGGVLLAFGAFLVMLFIVERLPISVEVILENFGKNALFLFIVYNFMMGITFYGVGFNLYGEVTVATMVLIVFIITVILFILSYMMKKFNITRIESLL